LVITLLNRKEYDFNVIDGGFIKQSINNDFVVSSMTIDTNQSGLAQTLMLEIQGNKVPQKITMSAYNWLSPSVVNLNEMELTRPKLLKEIVSSIKETVNKKGSIEIFISTFHREDFTLRYSGSLTIEKVISANNKSAFEGRFYVYNDFEVEGLNENQIYGIVDDIITSGVNIAAFHTKLKMREKEIIVNWKDLADVFSNRKSFFEENTVSLNLEFGPDLIKILSKEGVQNMKSIVLDTHKQTLIIKCMELSDA